MTEDRSAPFAGLAEVADAVSRTTSKLRKRDLLADYLRALPGDDVPIAATFFAGRPLPGAQDRLGLGWVQQSQALAAASGAGAAALNAAYLRHSDIGDAAAELLAGRTAAGKGITLRDVDRAFRTISEAASAEARVTEMARLLGRATADEARFIAKIASREMRIGLREGLLEEAIAAAFDRPVADVRRGLMLVGEPGETAALARDDALGTAALHLGRPIRFMLATPVADSVEVMRRVGEEAWIEDKYDGIRAQLHLEGGAAQLFSRDLNDITVAFPEVADVAATLPHRLVIDGELVPYRQGSVMDFASLQTRLGRVNPGPELLEQVPVVLVAFDLLHLDGRDLLETPLRERRAALEALDLPGHTAERVLYSNLATARSADEVEREFDDARERRNEGLMVKDPASVYQPGRRGLGWLKLKKALATLDCVVVGVEWGHGKRRAVLSDYTFAVRAGDEADAPLLTIGKAYTGLTDAEIATMTEHFKSITLRDFGRYRTVHPEVVVEIAFDRIMRSTRHKSGFAMRFPRIVRMRDDKTPADIDTMATVEALFGEQATGRILLARGSGGETERIAATGEVGE
ncbi:MAG TPA: ATP-dependent DNA ligase [Candidatus Limnocylindria bacterium]|nr:ATP-dependent DNA ligase [Candidatus Limnocylindria bacterium]